MTNPLISIIVPVYNVENYLSRCIDSLLNQSYQNIETVLVDDGSTDSSLMICNSYNKKDSRVKVFHKINEGAGVARKFGVNKAKGDFVVFVDSDDTIPLNAIEKLIDLQESNDYDITIGNIYNDYSIVKLKNNKHTQKTSIEGEMTNYQYLEGILTDKVYVGPCAKLYKKHLFYNDWQPTKEIIQNEDLLMLVYLTSKADRIYISNNDIVYNYMHRPNSASSKTMSLESWYTLFDSIYNGIEWCINNNQSVYSAFCKYRLRCLYVYCITNGIWVDTDDRRIEDVLHFPYKEKILKRFLFFVKSKYLQKIAFCISKGKRTIKSILKK